MKLCRSWKNHEQKESGCAHNLCAQIWSKDADPAPPWCVSCCHFSRFCDYMYGSCFIQCSLPKWCLCCFLILVNRHHPGWSHCRPITRLAFINCLFNSGNITKTWNFQTLGDGSRVTGCKHVFNPGLLWGDAFCLPSWNCCEGFQEESLCKRHFFLQPVYWSQKRLVGVSQFLLTSPLCKTWLSSEDREHTRDFFLNCQPCYNWRSGCKPGAPQSESSDDSESKRKWRLGSKMYSYNTPAMKLPITGASQ